MYLDVGLQSFSVLFLEGYQQVLGTQDISNSTEPQQGASQLELLLFLPTQ